MITMNQARLMAIQSERIVRASVGLDEIQADDFTWMRYGKPASGLPK